MQVETTAQTTAKTLPITKPLMHGFNYYGFMLAILGSYEQAESWIHSNFTNMELYHKFPDGHTLPIAPCLLHYHDNPNPWLSEQRLHRDHLATFGIKINDLLIDSINKGYYAYLNIDEFYIPDRGSYGERNFAHDILVFGYDLEAEVFDVLGFKANGMFAPTQVPFAEFEQAYLSLDNIDNWRDDIRLMKFNEQGQYKFQPHLVADQLEDYLLSRNTYERFYAATDPYTWDLVYGLSIYEHLKTYFGLLIEEKIWLDIKYLHNLWEHKKGMIERIKYMEKHQILDAGLGYSARYQEIEQRVLTFRNMVFRCSIDFKMERLQKIIDGLDVLAHDEAEILRGLIGELRGEPNGHNV